MSTSINIITSSPFTAIPNSYLYYICSGYTNPTFIFNLSNPIIEENVITIINNSPTNLQIYSNLGVLIDTITQGKTSIYLPNPLTNSWDEILTGSSTNTSSSRGSSLIPTLLGNTSKDDWIISASSNSTSSAPFNPFGGNDGSFWGPATGGPEYLRMDTPFINSGSPNPIYVQAILWENKGSSDTNYFSNITFQGSNDLITFTTLHTFTPEEMQTSNNINYLTLPSTYNFAAYQITITATVGLATNLGFFNFNLIGYWQTL
jgi:hypothetical protein